ncbi:hypothetical protein TCSYLVIO_000904, partial [Trypanosoma cruzi]
PILQMAQRNGREGKWSLFANDARMWHNEAPTSPLWASYMRRANEVAREMCAPSTWEQRMPLAGQFTTFCCTHERPMNEESCAVFLMGRCGAIDPTAVRKVAAVHVGNGSNPAGHADSGVTKSCGAIGDEGRDESSAPLDKEEMNQYIRSRTDWKERVVLRLAWITASRWSEIAALTANNFKLEPDGTLILDWSVAPKTARADPHRASRFVKIRGQDAFDIIKLCRTLQENEKLTNLTSAQVERALAPWMPQRIP